MHGTMYDPRVGSCPWLWMWLFGCFYLMVKGMWGHAILWVLTCWTVIIPIIYIFTARSLVYNHMSQRGLLK